MLINWHDPDYVYLVCGKTDLRKGIDGLAMVIAENYGEAGKKLLVKLKEAGKKLLVKLKSRIMNQF